MTSADPASNPRVGVGAVIRNPTTGKLLVGRRLSSHGHGTWQFPGGHLEYAESVFTCAERETLEETGLVVQATRLAAVTNSVFSDAGKHYITLFVLCEPVDPSAEPQ
ncbi:Nudix hydrolase 1, partial [Colletotrichum tanaceti]